MYEYSSIVYEQQYFILRAFNNSLLTTLYIYSRLVFCVFFSFVSVKQEIRLSENWGHMRKQWGMPEWGQGKKFFLFFSFPHLLPHCFHTWPSFSLCKTVSLTLQNTTKKHPKKTTWSLLSVLKYSYIKCNIAFVFDLCSLVVGRW